MTPKLTPEQVNALHAGGDAPLPVVDPTTQQIYYVVDRELMATMKDRSDLEGILEGIADMEAGRSVPIEQARAEDRAELAQRYEK